MRLFFHDLPRYAFTVQLAAELVRRGHQVAYSFSAEFMGPNSTLSAAQKDTGDLHIEPIILGQPYHKYSFIRRRFQERTYGSKLAERIIAYDPDIAIFSNTPLDILTVAQRKCKRRDLDTVIWVQDINSLAIGKFLKDKIPLLGPAITAYYANLEKNILNLSQGVISITEDFSPILQRWLQPETPYSVIPNWFPIDDFPIEPKINPWSRRWGLQDKFVFLYSGTLALKHDPSHILDLARSMKSREDVVVLVVSEGPGADYLKNAIQHHSLDNLICLGFQDYDMLPDMLGTADVLIALLKAEAGAFSVPSKILSYFCAGKPVLLSVPPANMAAQIVEKHGLGLISNPDDPIQLIGNAIRLLENPEERRTMGSRARQYAEDHFQIDSIADQFEQLFTAVFSRRE